jgi:NhaP-type Na+/H+ or K+/H+ antiporter
MLVTYGLPVLALFVFAYALVSKRLATTAVTGPMLFVAFGVVTGSHVLGWIDPAAEWDGVRLLLEVTLVLVLFADAFAINTSRWREDALIPTRLLGIGLPLTMLAGWGLAAVLAPGLSLWEAGLIGVLLAPTDAALGQAVVSNPRVPERIRVALNVESGLNDGLALPIFFVFLELAEASAGTIRPGEVVGEIIAEVGLALMVGVGIGVVGAYMLAGATKRGLTDAGWAQVALGALALAAWATANAAGGSGFIAAWVAGAAFGHVAREAVPGIHEFVEESSHLLALVSLYVFGAIGVGLVIDDLTWAAAVYAVLSLTVVRMVPVALAAAGSGLGRPTVLYLGWFGPRGLASMILVLIVVQEADLAGTPVIVLFTAATVTLSVLAHGVTAVWGSNAYADWCETHPEGAAIPEIDTTAPVRILRRFGGSPPRGG